MIDVWMAVLPAASQALLFRTVPFAALALLSRRVGRIGKLSAALALVTAALACGNLHPHSAAALLDCTLAWLYLALAALTAFVIARHIDGRRTTTPTLIMAAATLFLLAPALLVRNSATFLLLASGFELSFSTQSYWRERSGPAARLDDCLSFLLVNPLLVYPVRAPDASAPGWSARAASRVMFGISSFVVAPLLGIAAAASAAGLSGLHGAGLCPQELIGPTRLSLDLWAQYIGHAGLAHFQIGAMGLFGYSLPERYNAPFLARSPDDFWRRWNAYLGQWLQRYAYLPLALRCQRSLSRRYWVLGKGAALIATFAVCGFMHEFAGYVLRVRWPVGVLVAFCGYGVVLAGWLGLRHCLVALRPGSLPSGGSAARILMRVGSTAATAMLVLLFGAVALPALAGVALEEQLVHWSAP